MSNEIELKILDELKSINTRLDGVDERLDGMDKRFDGVDKRFEGMDKRFDSVTFHLEKHDKFFTILNKKLDTVEKDLASVKKSTLLMEHDYYDKIQALLDQYMLNHENHVFLDMKLDSLKSTVDSHSFEIEHLKNKTLNTV